MPRACSRKKHSCGLTLCRARTRVQEAKLRTLQLAKTAAEEQAAELEEDLQMTQDLLEACRRDHKVALAELKRLRAEAEVSNCPRVLPPC